MLDAETPAPTDAPTAADGTETRQEALVDRARSLRDLLGWSRPFEAGLPPTELTERMDRAGILRRDPETGLLRAGLRLSSLDDALFFGPDTVCGPRPDADRVGRVFPAF